MLMLTLKQRHIVFFIHKGTFDIGVKEKGENLTSVTIKRVIIMGVNILFIHVLWLHLISFFKWMNLKQTFAKTYSKNPHK